MYARCRINVAICDLLADCSGYGFAETLASAATAAALSFCELAATAHVTFASASCFCLCRFFTEWKGITLTITLAARQPPSCTIYRWQHPSNSKLHHASGPTAAYMRSDNAEHYVQQIEKLEKQLFAKSDGWRGGMLQQELNKRNTFCLYAVKEIPEGASSPIQGLSESEVTAANSHPIQQDQTGEHQQPHQIRSTVLGYIVVQVNSVTAHINKLAVAPQARRQGLGAALLKAALQIAIYERRALCSTLHVDASNIPALTLYKKAGFKQDGLIRDYYGVGKDACKLLADFQESQIFAAFVQQ